MSKKGEKSQEGRSPAHIPGIQRDQSQASATRQNIILNRARMPTRIPTARATVNVDPKFQPTQERFDEYGAELEPDARVWKTYVREADKFDAEQVEGWNRSLDVTLSKLCIGAEIGYSDS
ncbi:hypothetical protein RSAG8_13724, partial [Rhizoctonia solani AG-8 WAC10335]